ncbi:hypothetical protein XthCFBP4691_07640 [Xanthomonas theicola]|uniref:Uncharacterized protein n=2 Tax=Xanthomonas theicola TaxID=56464 RepID=A0A2S6ZGK9_9XANT|nr:hypothetical protein XthCFBP4691_07640 [Xanthomonas theicola]
MTERLVTMVKPSELEQIKKRAQRVNLNTSDYMRKSALGDLPPAFDLLAEELAASAARAHKAIDASLEAIKASEARLDALEAAAGQRSAAV